jgi:hypothetical protein
VSSITTVRYATSDAGVNDPVLMPHHHASDFKMGIGAALLKGGQNRSLANLAARPKAAARRGSRFGEQDGSRGLGDYEQTGHLPTRSSGSLTYKAAACRELARVKQRDGTFCPPDREKPDRLSGTPIPTN